MMITSNLSDSDTIFNGSIFEIKISGDFASNSTYISQTGTLSVNLREKTLSVFMREKEVSAKLALPGLWAKIILKERTLSKSSVIANELFLTEKMR